MAEPKFLIEINYHENDSEEGVSGDVDYRLDQRLPDFIHKYGRNGKDRIILMLAAMMRRVEGFYQDFSKSVDEDIEISGDPVSDEEL